MTEPEALVDLLYAERRPGRWAHRPSVQAIGRLDDAAFEALAGELRARGLLEPSDSDDLELSDDGAALARERWAARSPTPHWRIPAPALPYRELPVEAGGRRPALPVSRLRRASVSARSAAWKALAARRLGRVDVPGVLAHLAASTSRPTTTTGSRHTGTPTRAITTGRTGVAGARRPLRR